MMEIPRGKLPTIDDMAFQWPDFHHVVEFDFMLSGLKFVIVSLKPDNLNIMIDAFIKKYKILREICFEDNCDVIALHTHFFETSCKIATTKVFAAMPPSFYAKIEGQIPECFQHGAVTTIDLSARG